VSEEIIAKVQERRSKAVKQPAGEGVRAITDGARNGEREIERNKPHVNVGTIGHIDHARPRDGAITKVLQKHNPKIVFPVV